MPKNAYIFDFLDVRQLIFFIDRAPSHPLSYLLTTACQFHILNSELGINQPIRITS
jgi:hypothetical protein